MLRLEMALSARGRALQGPPPPSLKQAYAARADRFSADNRKGYIDLSVSENSVSLPLLYKKLSSLKAPPPSWLLYDSSHGSAPFLKQLALFLTSHFFPKTTGASPSNLITASGAGACLDMLTSVLCDPGDQVLVQGPTYGGFARDLCKRAQAEIVVAPTDLVKDDMCSRVSVQTLHDAWCSAGGDRSRVRMVLIVSPSNPQGEVLSPHIVADVVKWSRARGLHVVFDEAYALSVYSDKREFCSVAKALDGQLGDDVHIVWTLSKDFCWSGGRVGVMYTLNEDVLSALRPALTYLAGVSRQTQWTVAEMLCDEEWVMSFVRENRRRLLETRSKVAEMLRKMGVPFFPADAGLFLWIDLRAWMWEDTYAEEMALWERMAAVKVLLTPGSECFATCSGFFRVCFAAVEEDALQLAFERLTESVLNAERRRNVAAPISWLCNESS